LLSLENVLDERSFAADAGSFGRCGEWEADHAQ